MFQLKVKRVEDKFMLGQGELQDDAVAGGHKMAESTDSTKQDLSQFVVEHKENRDSRER